MYAHLSGNGPPPPASNKQVGGDHYKCMSVQPWDFIAANGLGFFEGNCIKYICRWRTKGGIQDLEKARHYLDKLLELARAEDEANVSKRIAAKGEGHSIVLGPALSESGY